MNSIKTLVIVVALAATGYVVFISLSGGPEPTPPPGSPEQAAGLPQINLGEVGQQSVTASMPTAGASPGGEAPPFVPGGTPSAGLDLPAPKVGPLGLSTPGREVAPPSVAPPGAPPATADLPERQLDGSPRQAADDRGVREPFRNFMQAACVELDHGNFAEVLKELTRYYKHPELTPEESQALVELLDQVAGTVVYSRQHLLEAPYRIKPGETLPQIASQYNVPWQLLAKINGIRSPDDLRPGQEIKVVRGPFHAQVDLADGEATVFLQDSYYAGRFPLDAGRHTPDLAGSYTIQNKSGPSRDAPGAALALELDDRVRLEGGGDPNAVAGPSASPRAIRFGRHDIQDMVDILSVGSRVVIRR